MKTPILEWPSFMWLSLALMVWSISSCEIKQAEFKKEIEIEINKQTKDNK